MLVRVRCSGRSQRRATSRTTPKRRHTCRRLPEAAWARRSTRIGWSRQMARRLPLAPRKAPGAASAAAPSRNLITRALSNAMGVRLPANTSMSDLLAGNVGHPSLSGLITGEGIQKNALGQNKSGALLSPAVGGLLRGLVSPIDLADKYIAAPLTRMIPESLGGNPNEQ